MKLRKSKAYRWEQNSTIALGYKLSSELQSYAKAIITTDDDATIPRFNTLPIYLTTQENLKKITGVANPEPILAEVQLPPSSDLKNCKRLIVVDNVQDPGNLGAIIRSTYAFGFDGIFCIGQTVDPFNDKVIRSSKGACFFVPYRQGNLDECLTFCRENHLQMYCADLDGDSLGKHPFDSKLALVFGNESKGISESIKQVAQVITIPIAEKCDSLNVSVAAGILMHHIVRES